MVTTFYFLVIAHFVADFILQGSLAIKKRGLNKYMLFHSLVMALAFFLPLINYPAGKTVIGALVIFIVHILIDAIRKETTTLFKIEPGTYLFAVSLGIDQVLHVSALYFVFTYLIIG